ncbi:hypothetical protein BDZ89DRAFT_1044796 [Hymenopellis radicata]|nr:hypothetical protein BDZ89DRAFT_1044796 [Hymenopellis radicata]
MPAAVVDNVRAGISASQIPTTKYQRGFDSTCRQRRDLAPVMRTVNPNAVRLPCLPLLPPPPTPKERPDGNDDCHGHHGPRLRPPGSRKPHGWAAQQLAKPTLRLVSSDMASAMRKPPPNGKHALLRWDATPQLRNPPPHRVRMGVPCRLLATRRHLLKLPSPRHPIPIPISIAAPPALSTQPGNVAGGSAAILLLHQCTASLTDPRSLQHLIIREPFTYPPSVPSAAIPFSPSPRCKNAAIDTTSTRSADISMSAHPSALAFAGRVTRSSEADTRTCMTPEYFTRVQHPFASVSHIRDGGCTRIHLVIFMPSDRPRAIAWGHSHVHESGGGRSVMGVVGELWTVVVVALQDERGHSCSRMHRALEIPPLLRSLIVLWPLEGCRRRCSTFAARSGGLRCADADPESSAAVVVADLRSSDGS